MNEESKRWIEAGKVLGADPTAHVLCPPVPRYPTVSDRSTSRRDAQRTAYALPEVQRIQLNAHAGTGMTNPNLKMPLADAYASNRSPILGYATYACEPEWFTLAPVGAIKKLSSRLSWQAQDVDLYEINEAFAVVTMVATVISGLIRSASTAAPAHGDIQSEPLAPVS